MAYNDNGVNWFGQVGARTTQPRPQVSAPALSQIPGLNKASGGAPDTDEPQRQFFRDTDSAYVRLAKQGGRTDLLRMDQDSVAGDTKANAYAIPSWMQQDSVNEDLPSSVETASRVQNTCFPSAMVSETRAAYTGDTLQLAGSRHGRILSPSHQFLQKKATVDIFRKPTLAEKQFTFAGNHCEPKETIKPGNYESDQQLKAAQQVPVIDAALPQTPACNTLIQPSVQRQSSNNAEKQLSTMQCGFSPTSVTATQAKDSHGSEVAQYYGNSGGRCQSEVQREEEETRAELLRQIGSVNSRKGTADFESAKGNNECDARIELRHQDSTSSDKDDLDFLDNRSQADQWDARQSSPPPGDRNSSNNWSRKASAEGGRQLLQSESQSAFVNKQSGDGESPARESPYGRYESNASPQKPYADHGYQMPLSSETSSAYSEKPFQTPAVERRSSASKLQEDFYSRNAYQVPSRLHPSVTPSLQQQQQQPAGVNRLKHSDSMSKLLSFGYLKGSENDSSQVAAGRSQPRIERGYVPNTYTTEYKEKMHSTRGATGANASTPHSATSIQSTGTYVPTPISDPGHRRRKQSFEERPDFFKIGSVEPQSSSAFGIRKPSAETRPDFFGNERTDSQSASAYGIRKASAETRPDFFGKEQVSNAATISYAKTRNDGESKPDFFKIGSLDNYQERQGEQKKPEDGGLFDKLNGYHGVSQKTNFRRRKMDINGPMLTAPVKAVSRF